MHKRKYVQVCMSECSCQVTEGEWKGGRKHFLSYLRCIIDISVKKSLIYQSQQTRKLDRSSYSLSQVQQTTSVSC